MGTRGGGPSLYSLTQENRLELQYFEDLLLGGHWTSRRRTVTESDLVAFSGLSGDFNPLHIDRPLAESGHFRGRVAQAGLVSAIAVGLGSMDVPASATVAMVGMTWRFLGPVRPGDTIHCRWRLARKRAVEDPRWGLAVWAVEVIEHQDQVVAQGEIARLVARRTPLTESGAASRGRHRRRRPGTGATAVPLAEMAAVPEPAPQEAPAPARRRSRRSPASPAQPVAPERTAEPQAGTEEGPQTPTQARRRRRRRGSGSRAEPVAGAPEPAHQPDPTPDATPIHDVADSATSPPRDPSPGIGGVLRRLRRTRPPGSE